MLQKVDEWAGADSDRRPARWLTTSLCESLTGNPDVLTRLDDRPEVQASSQSIYVWCFRRQQLRAGCGASPGHLQFVIASLSHTRMTMPSI